MRERRQPGHERRVLLLALLSPLPAIAIAGALLWTAGGAPAWRWLIGAGAVVVWLAGAFAIKRRVVRALQSITNLLGALRQGDFSIRGLRVNGHDALADVLAEANGLAETLGQQRTGTLEASALLDKVMSEIDVAIFAFDGHLRLALVNRAGERLLGAPAAKIAGAPAETLGLAPLLEGPAPRTVDATFPAGQGQWEVRRGTFRLGGLPHELLVLTDLRRALREEERLALQRIIRVLGHEINNSLAPIRSIAGDLGQTVSAGGKRPADWEEDLARGLAVIERRAEGLGRFMSSYARLARLPPPRFAAIDVGPWLRRVVELERRLPVRLDPGPDATISGDRDQLDQLLINLLQNGADAALETGGGVSVSWRKLARTMEIDVVDEGPGLAATANLFVPFFTTKPAGSGIGLVLSRQIAEAHRGTLTLETRRDRAGAVARLCLPI